MGSRGASAALNASQASVSMGAAGNNARKEEIRGRIDEINTVLNDYSLTSKERTRLEKEQDGLYEELGGINREQRISEIVRKLDADDFKSAAERDKLRAEYDRLNNERSVATTRRFNTRNRIKGVWQ